MPPEPLSKPIVITLKGISIPSFKNSKMIITRSHGRPLPRPMLITDPKKKKTMDLMIKAIKLQLISMFQTGEGVTSMEQLQHALMHLLPQDDNCWEIPDLHVRLKQVSKGSEGATITINKIQ